MKMKIIVEHLSLSTIQPLNKSFANSLPKLDEASKMMMIMIEMMMTKIIMIEMVIIIMIMIKK
jgi:hypothetical protein